MSCWDRGLLGRGRDWPAYRRSRSGVHGARHQARHLAGSGVCHWNAVTTFVQYNYLSAFGVFLYNFCVFVSRRNKVLFACQNQNWAGNILQLFKQFTIAGNQFVFIIHY